MTTFAQVEKRKCSTSLIHSQRDLTYQRGSYGQYITVLPAIDMVVAHKTVPDDSTSWEAYQGILDRLVDARCGDACN